ncbi:MAG TPA: ferric reductase-like transmembrane domain-containing protein [Streptosporangiaceae bacterium]
MTTGHLLLSAPSMSGTSLLWYTTRATGIVALVLLTGTVMLGVVGTARAASPRWPRIVTAGLHRNLALTATALVGVHIITTVLDPYASISVVAAFIPFSSPYRPLWLSLGTVGFDLLLAVLITSLLRDRLSHRLWQAVHLMVYVSWPVALWHGLGTGTDTKLPFVLAIDVLCVAGVGWAIWWRLSMTENPMTRLAGLAALAFAPLLTLAFVIFGPLQQGWAQRAGTPTALLGSRTQTQTQTQTQNQTPAASTGASKPVHLVDAKFTGHLTIATAQGQRTITISGSTVAAPKQSFVILLQGAPAGASGVSLTGGTVRIGNSYSGPVIQLAGKNLVAAVSGQAGQRHAVFTLTINGSAVTGTVSLLAETGD